MGFRATLLNLIKSFQGPRPTEKDVEQGRSQQSSFVPDVAVQNPASENAEIANDPLSLFRLLVGITSHPTMSHHGNLFHGGRPASNLGIYARVVHNEADAKRGYKHWSLVINGCLGVQLIVAAALTAMGAAGARRSAVTVFGAINTVIAGLLTFLKGSGLPNRLRYYQAEWRKVREFIEQRERDFSRPGCTLDPHVVATLVEKLYEETKADLESNTPDRYASLKNSSEPVVKASEIHIPRREAFMERVKELGSGTEHKIKDLASHVEHNAEHAAEDLEKRKEDLITETHKNIEAYAEKASNLVRDVPKDVLKSIDG
ncbi:hypothetical protein B7494_g7733 [Chlorociboria aeruginascens]|nr:hypothetical protein B7494_g7733 [Chlorociboria aeruginascens]